MAEAAHSDGIVSFVMRESAPLFITRNIAEAQVRELFAAVRMLAGGSPSRRTTSV